MEREIDRGPVLARLDALVGDWEMKAVVGGQPVMGGRTTGAWIEGGAFLALRADAEPPSGDVPPEWIANSPLPTTSIVGLDDMTERFAYLYADARGIQRVYDMTLADGTWEIWGQSGPEFFQRFAGHLSADGQTIDGRWERSSDGESWQLDFELAYTKLA